MQGECRSIGEFDAPEVDLALQAAVGALRERPVLFKYCAEEVATARHNALFQVRQHILIVDLLMQIDAKSWRVLSVAFHHCVDARRARRHASAY